MGDEGTILLTTDGGASWTARESGTSRNVYSVCFANALDGLAVGGEIGWLGTGGNGIVLRTSDGGVTWSKQDGDWSGHCLGSVFSLGYKTITIVGNDGSIFHTTDGGSKWTQQESGTTNNLFSVCFQNISTGIAVGFNGTILRTTDEGTTWSLKETETNSNLYSVSFSDARNCIIVGENGTILKTTNGGITWVSKVSGTREDLHSVFFLSKRRGIAVGGFGTIIKTTDGGETWASQESGTNQTLWNVFFTSSSHGIAVGSNGSILRTVRAGLPIARSRGETTEVPDVTGKNIDLAKAILEAKGFKPYQEDAVFDQNIPEGCVVRQDRVPGENIVKGEIVKITVSKGLEQILVPYLNKVPLPEAQAQLEKLGLKMGRVTVAVSDSVATDCVISSFPVYNTAVPRGANVEFIVSGGNEKVVIPKVTGMGLSRAREALEKLGLQINVRYATSKDIDPGIVIQQEPDADAVCRKGEIVNLWVSYQE